MLFEDYPLYRALPEPVVKRGAVDEPAVGVLLLTDGKEPDRAYISRLWADSGCQFGSLFIVCAGETVPRCWQDAGVADERIRWFHVPSTADTCNVICTLQNDPARYLFLTDGSSPSILSGVVRCMRYMDMTDAYGMYPKSALCAKDGLCKMPRQHIDEGVFAWKFCCAGELRSLVHNFSMTLYRKEHVMRWINGLAAQGSRQERITSDMLRHSWKTFPVDKHAVGLMSST